jgi:glycosyltransferase involved in cell wall biosynthesis
MGTSGPTLRVLGFEPFDAGSHEAIRRSISRHSRHDWTWVTSAGRAWKWRMRTAAIHMTDGLESLHERKGPFDIVVASSLMSLADLRAFWDRAGMPRAAFVLSMHENQAAYPEGHATAVSRDRDVHFALTNLTSMLAADRVIFNSRWNRESFLDGIEALLRHAPEPAFRGIRPRLASSSVVLWPPVEGPPADTGDVTRPLCEPGEPIRVVWPHRWEHDKGPEELLAIARGCTVRANLRWTILGQSFERVPEAMRAFQEEFRDRIDHMGFVESRREYWKRLHRCDWVLSTARHEFFGIAVVEALLAGCLPWLPDRLSYSEIIPDMAKGLSPLEPPDDPNAVRAAVRTRLAPARADEAVRRLDEALDELAQP